MAPSLAAQAVPAAHEKGVMLQFQDETGQEDQDRLE